MTKMMTAALALATLVAVPLSAQTTNSTGSTQGGTTGGAMGSGSMGQSGSSMGDSSMGGSSMGGSSMGGSSTTNADGSTMASQRGMSGTKPMTRSQTAQMKRCQAMSADKMAKNRLCTKLSQMYPMMSQGGM